MLAISKEMGSLLVLAFYLYSGLAFQLREEDASLVNNAMMMARPMARYKKDCWKNRPVGLLQVQLDATTTDATTTAPGHVGPGVGMHPIEPYSTVFMDGYLKAACVKDYMYEHGDKFGNNKFAYEVGSSHNVSIIHYTEIVAKEDQKPMTIERCFEFCRTVTGMLFFGITKGRDCYCEPFFKQMAGDSSQCDAVCEGQPTQMCGGMKKSNIFAMHKCDDTAEELSTAISTMAKAAESLTNIGTQIKDLADDGQNEASDLQKRLGTAGDPVAADLMQSAMVWAGELVHPAEEGIEFADSLTSLKDEGDSVASDLDTSSAESFTKAEDIIGKAKEGKAEAEAKTEKLEELLHLAHPNMSTPEGAPKAIAQYMPLMYFVDKEFQNNSATCGGDVVKKPLLDLDDNGCAMACDAEINSCIGFSYFPEGICFLFSKFKSVQYYTGCSTTGFLQMSLREDSDAKCFAKLSSFEGINLTPDPSGKCDLCLKTATKADRCY